MTSDKPETPYVELGTFLRDLRAQTGWSLRKAAQEIGGISHSRLQDFERGLDPHSAIPTKPTEDQLKRMAKAYQADPAKLLRLAGYSPIGPLSEWEEKLVLKARSLNSSQRQRLESLLEELSG